MLEIESVFPTLDMLASHEYLLVTEVFAVMLADTPVDRTAITPRDWLLTVDGQEAVKESGYVPIQ